VPNGIDVYARTNVNLGTTLQTSLSALRANRIEVVAAAEFINAGATPFARILSRNVGDKPALSKCSQRGDRCSASRALRFEEIITGHERVRRDRRLQLGKQAKFSSGRRTSTP